MQTKQIINVIRRLQHRVRGRALQPFLYDRGVAPYCRRLFRYVDVNLYPGVFYVGEHENRRLAFVDLAPSDRGRCEESREDPAYSWQNLEETPAARAAPYCGNLQ